MQNLLIDIGNSRLKWAVEESNRLDRGTDIRLSDGVARDVVKQNWPHLKVEHVLISCVANKQVQQEFVSAIQSQFGISPLVLISPQSGHGIQNAYAQPEKLGSDRWAAMVAAYDWAKGAVCVVDCGTAVTLDAIDKSGQHLGGLIVPGLMTTQHSLSQHTNMDFQTEVLEQGGLLLGQSTEQCIQHGAYSQIIALIKNTYMELCNQYGSMGLILTGGDADTIQSGLGLSAGIDPDLVLKGLAQILHTQVETSSS